jgi:hypothetical protein
MSNGELITILVRTDNQNWTSNEQTLLAAALLTQVWWQTDWPQHMIISGAYDKETIQKFLKHGNFSDEVVIGINNPKIPFKIQLQVNEDQTPR